MSTKATVFPSSKVDGLQTFTVRFAPIWAQRPEQNVVEEAVLVRLPKPVRIGRVWTFVGTDQGNAGEFAMDVIPDGGLRLYQRSFHKEDPLGLYDAWDAKDVGPVKVRDLTVILHAQFTGAPGRVHFELILETVR